MIDIETAPWTCVMVSKWSVWVIHIELKQARIFLNMAIVLEVPEVTHDVRGVVKDFGDALGCLVSKRSFDWGLPGDLKEEIITYFGWEVVDGTDCFSLESLNFLPLASGHVWPGGN